MELTVTVSEDQLFVSGGSEQVEVGIKTLV
jgi:hypothetical protein